jgi:hypothetical protein
MSSNFPAALDVLTVPSGLPSMGTFRQGTLLTDLGDAVEAVQAKVGADSSAVTSSLDYRIGAAGTNLDAHAVDTTGIHGITDTAKLLTTDTAQTVLGVKTFAPASGTGLLATSPQPAAPYTVATAPTGTSTPSATLGGVEVRAPNISSVGVGSTALGNATTATDNTAVGTGALSSATTGGNSVAVGASALAGQTTGTQNVALGVNALHQPAGLVANTTTTGTRQVAVGMEAGQNSTTQRAEAIAVGYRALFDADGAIALGASAQALHAGSVALGLSTATTAADQVMIGPRDLEITATAKGLVLVSPIGTRYRVQVDDAGVLSTVAA